MKYKQGNIGRVFVAKIEHGENLLEEIKRLAVKENISSAIVYVIGALKGASIVTGPKECTVPPDPNRERFNDGREMLGVGTIFRENGEPVLHMHSTFGKGKATLMGCVRSDAEVYLVAEVIILELENVGAIREIDENIQLSVLGFKL